MIQYAKNAKSLGESVGGKKSGNGKSDTKMSQKSISISINQTKINKSII